MVSVTKLLSLLDKPAILKWANKIGLEGISLDDHRNKTQAKGNKGHDKIERYFKEGIEFEGVELLKKELEGFIVLGCEIKIDNGFINGRIDLALEKNNEIYICDFKSSKKIYLATKLQLSTYKHIYGGHKICFINLDTFKIEVININTEPYFNIVKRLYQVHELLTNLNERL